MSFPNVSEMGYQFLLLLPAKDTQLADDMRDNGYGDLLEHYTLADEEDLQNGGTTVTTLEELGPVTLEKVKTVSLHGGDHECRCYDGTALVYVDAAGRRWLDEQLHDEIFC